MDALPPQEKPCSICKIVKPLTEFRRDSRTKDGHISACKDCKRTEYPAWYAANSEAKKAKARTAYLEREARRKEDPELDAHLRKLARAKSARARARNPEAAKAAMKSWASRNKDKLNAYRRMLYAINPETILERNRRREYLRKGSAESTLTDAQFEVIKAAYNYRCVYCPPDCKNCVRKKHQLTRDHITPVSKGGPDTIHNVVPACRSCNARKQDGEVLKPVQPLLLL